MCFRLSTHSLGHFFSKNKLIVMKSFFISFMIFEFLFSLLPTAPAMSSCVG